MALTTYATGDDLASWMADADPVADATELELAVVAASRAIDRACGRSFGLVDQPEERRYTAEFDRFARRWIVDIDDVTDTDDLLVEVNGAEVLGYLLTPINGQPFTRIEILPSAAVQPTAERYGVTVTALWGWPEVPESIVLATLMQAARFYARRENPSGPLQSKKVDDVSLGWHATDLDADVAVLVAPYRKTWGAV